MDVCIRKRVSPAIMVIIIFGIISMLGDMVYESARSANTQYLNLLGMSAFTVGVVFGMGELLGYALRLVAGVLSDKTGRPWVFIFVGYGMLAVVPLMGLTMSWNILIVLILMERMGKALRNPAKDTVLSCVAEKQVGVGTAFGIQEALDQVGAFIGPLVFTAIFYYAGKNGIPEYQLGYQTLIIPFALLMFFLFLAYRKVQREGLIPEVEKREYHKEKLKPIFWTYTVFAFFCTLGFVNFSTVGYHLKDSGIMSDGGITLLYAFAMLVDAIAALIVGKKYDKLKIKTGRKTGGILVLALVPLITLLLPILTLSDSVALVVVGMAVFGIIMGTHETVMRSAIADVTPFHKRGTGYGVFNASYGLALLGGAALMGLFYDMNQTGWIFAFALMAEAVAIVLFIKMDRMIKNGD